MNGITYTLELAKHYAEANNQRGAEIEIYNALVELQVLREELDKQGTPDHPGEHPFH